MATIDAVAGNAAAPGKGAQKGKGLVHGEEGAGSFMAVLMQLLGNDFSQEEIGKLEALVIGGIRKGKGSEAGKEASLEAPGDGTGSLGLLAATLQLIAGKGTGLAELKTGGQDVIGKKVIEAAGLASENSTGKAVHLKLKQAIKVLQGGAKAPAGSEAAAPESINPGNGPESEIAGKASEKASSKQSAGTEVPGSAVKSEKNEITIDLKALKDLLQKENQADPSLTATAPAPEAGAALNPLRLEQAFGEYLKPMLAQAAAAGGTDTVSIKIKDGDVEKKFTIRRNVLLAHQAESGPAETDGQIVAPDTGGKTPRIDPAGSKSFGSESFMQGDTARTAEAEHEKLLIKEMIKPAGQPGGKPAGDSDFSNVLVKYFSKGPEGQMEKVFYKEIETPGLEKKTLLIRTEIIRANDPAEPAETAPLSALPTLETGKAGSLEETKFQAVINQVAEGAESALKKDCSRVRMELNPPHLGTLDMDLLVSHDRVRMVIMADSQDVRNILHGNMDQLRSSLEQQGLKMDGIDVFVQDRYAGSQGDQSGHTRDGGRSQGHPFADGSGSALPPGGPEMERPKAIRRPDFDGAGLSVFA